MRKWITGNVKRSLVVTNKFYLPKQLLVLNILSDCLSHLISHIAATMAHHSTCALHLANILYFLLLHKIP